MLFSLKGENLYKFFMKATQLEDILGLYEDACIELSHAKSILERKKGQTKQLKKNLSECKKKFKFYLDIDEKKRNVERLKREFAYAQLNEAKYEHEANVKYLEKFKVQIAQCKETIQESDDLRNSLGNKRDTLEHDKEKMKEAGKNLHEEVVELRNLLRGAKAELKRVQMSKDLKEKGQRDIKKQLESVQKVIENLKSR